MARGACSEQGRALLQHTNQFNKLIYQAVEYGRVHVRAYKSLGGRGGRDWRSKEPQFGMSGPTFVYSTYYGHLISPSQTQINTNTPSASYSRIMELWTWGGWVGGVCGAVHFEGKVSSYLIDLPVKHLLLSSRYLSV